MIRLIYCSTAIRDVTDQELVDILRTARRNNIRNGITGMLMYHERAFLQVLEGAEEDVTACYDRIYRDPRHRGLITLDKAPASSRTFTDWSMGHVDPSALRRFGVSNIRSMAEIAARLQDVEHMEMGAGRQRTVARMLAFLRRHNLAEHC
ncbi:BLUF domain-containing protein [Loktanella agnita]|uniref:BLUF domain-containing protein n=1 Tax=Loktanella agnita TaxID=287097 RepID=UPI0039877647